MSTFNEPISPPTPPSQPDPHAEPAQVEGVVSERAHPPLPAPAAPPSAPLPSVDPTADLLPYNQMPSGFPVPAAPPNNPAPGLVAPPAPSREHGTPERVPQNGTASSQLPVDPSQHYLPDAPLPNTDPLFPHEWTHNP